MTNHKPVLLKETIKYLNPQAGENFIDCTIGFGGHALEIAKRIAPDGKILGLDVDKKSLGKLSVELATSSCKKNIILKQGNFKDLKKIAQENNFSSINGILIDLGISSWQIENSGRGFSFKKDEELDMRVDPINNQLTAKEIINYWPTEELERIFIEYGEERFSERIAKIINAERKNREIATSRELADLISKFIPRIKIHPATRIFQALRIAVNNELDNLKAVLPQAVEILSVNGRLVIISFHSLEDRIIKYFFRGEAAENHLEILTKKAIRPTRDEVLKNQKSRSAKLRAIRRATF